MQLSILPNDKHLDKTHLLLKERGILEMINSKKDGEFLNKLIELQKVIFSLDEFGETTKNIDQGINNKEIQEFMSEIQNQSIFDQFSGQQKSNLFKGFNELIKIELGMREGKNSAEYDIHSYYLAKICDVELQRKLVLNYLGIELESYKEGWMFYDLVGEIIDDIDDIQEDMKGYNSNRILSSVIKYGIEKTKQDYTNFIRDQLRLYLGFKNTNNELLTKIVAYSGECLNKLESLKIKKYQKSDIYKLLKSGH